MENCCLITLINRFKKHDMASFPAIFDEFEKLIRLYASRLREEDAFQELCVFLVELLYKIDLSGFLSDRSDSVRRYIAVCIRNRYIFISKKQDDYGDKNYILFENKPDLSPGPAEIQMLREAVLALTLRQREYVIYRYVYNYTDGEIAGFMKISPQAAGRLNKRAVKTLKEYFYGGK